MSSIDLCDLHTRNEPQELWHGRDARPTSVVLRDDIDSCRYIEDGLLLSRG